MSKHVVDEYYSCIDLIENALKTRKKIDSQTLNILMEQEDCFVISHKQLWESHKDFAHDVKVLEGYSTELKYIVVPDPSDESIREFIFKALDYVDYDNGAEIVKGDKFALISTYY